MPYELILSSDTLNQGRTKINDFFNQSQAGIFTGSTGTYSIISTGNENYAGGNRGFVHGYASSATTNYSTVINGTNNYSTPSLTTILGGKDNTILYTSDYSMIGGGNNNAIGNSFATSLRSAILNGSANKTAGNNSTVVNGSNNYSKFRWTTIVNGSQNQIFNRFSTILNGAFNTLGGTSDSTSTSYNTILGGSKNKISGTTVKHCISAGFRTWIPNLQTYSFLFGSGPSTGAYLSSNTLHSSHQMTLGSAGTRRVRFRFDTAPNAYLSAGSWQTSSADYGEYFEWKDKNINNETRVGYFVEIIDGKIKIANSNNVIGIISKTAAFIGDSPQDYWNEMHLKDEWGSIIQENYEIYEFNSKELDKDETNDKINIYFDSEGNSYINPPDLGNPKGTITNSYIKSDGKLIENKKLNVFNPMYDPKNEYIPRKDRPEWEVVGLLGKLRTRTSEQITGNYVDVDINTGMAKNGTKYPVLKKIKDFDGNYGVVLIFFK